MAPVVYVMPVAIIGGMHWDLHGDKPLAKEFDMMLSKVEDQDVNGFKVELLFDCPSSLVEGGKVFLNVEGDVCSGAVEAERSCMMRMVAAMRTTYGLAPADFNLIMLSEKRALFNAMRANIDAAASDFADLHTHLVECHGELSRITQSLSVWIGNNHPYVRYADVSAVAAFQAIISKHAHVLDIGVRHANCVVQSIVMRHAAPADQAILDATLPMPVEISWEGSYHTLLVIYTHAMRKLTGANSSLEVRKMRGGQFRASVEIPVDPWRFVGDAADSAKAAAAKLFVVVIKHVSIVMGHSVMDFHTGVREYQDGVIEGFNDTNDNLLKCGQKIYDLFGLTFATWMECLGALVHSIDVGHNTEYLMDAVHDVTIFLEAKKVAVEAKWNDMSPRRTTRATLEAQLAGDA